MNTHFKKDFVTLVVFVFAFLAWVQASILFDTYRDNIWIAIHDTVQEMVFPLKLAALALQDPLVQLPVPVYGVPLSDVEDTWGFARSEGRSHEGVDIFAPTGTPVFSVSEGYVVNTYFGHRGGNNVMVYGPGGVYYYYAHFERLAADVERGMKVTPDTMLGYVGVSGNAVGTPPHLHFGMYAEPWEATNPHPFITIDRWNAKR